MRSKPPSALRCRGPKCHYVDRALVTHCASFYDELIDISNIQQRPVDGAGGEGDKGLAVGVNSTPKPSSIRKTMRKYRMTSGGWLQMVDLVT